MSAVGAVEVRRRRVALLPRFTPAARSALGIGLVVAVAGWALAGSAEQVTRFTGYGSFALLLGSLSAAVARRLDGASWLRHAPSVLGRAAIVCAGGHLLSFVGLQHAFSLHELGDAVVQTPFVLLGGLAFALLAAAAHVAASGRRAATRRLAEWALALSLLHFAALADSYFPVLVAGLASVWALTQRATRRRDGTPVAEAGTHTDSRRRAEEHSRAA